MRRPSNDPFVEPQIVFRSGGREAPALSVVIAAFNGARHLPTQLSALAGQDLQEEFEVVVADNGSSDSTRLVVRSFSDRLSLTLLDASARRGQTFARNMGARAARAPDLLFLDQDDEVAPTYLSAMRLALRDQAFVAARVDLERLNAGWIAQTRELAQTVGLPAQPLPWAYGCTLGIRRDVFMALGGFDTSLYIAAEDMDLCWRAHTLGFGLTFVPEAVLHYRFADRHSDMFLQGRRYGIGQVVVNLKHAGLGIGRDPLRVAARRFLGTCRLACSRDPGRRGRGLFLLGRRIGLLEGSLRFGALFW